MNSIPGDFTGTISRMLDVDRRAAAAGADLVVFPSTLLAGVYPAAVSASVAFELDLLDAIEDYASRATVTAAVPAYVYDGMRGYTEVFLCDDGVAGPLRLQASERMDAQDDADALCATARVEGVRIQLVVDGTPPDLDDPADLIIVCPCLPFCDEDPSTLLGGGLADAGLQGTVEMAPSWLAAVQGVGGYDDVVLAGGSFAANPEGIVVAACPCFEGGLAFFDVPSPSDVRDAQAPADPGPAARQPAGASAGAGSLVGSSIADIPELTASQRTGMLWRALALATRDYVRKTGFHDVLVGLSGGLDSSVVAALAADALGPEHVRGVLMPGPYTSGASTRDALELARLLSIRTFTLPVSDLVAAADSTCAGAMRAPLPDLAYQNLQARMRGLALMTLSNATGALVLNTSNKSEAAMGYSTLYGDTVGAFSPLADVYKTRVYELARWRNAAGPTGLPAIPPSVLAKPPSAELAPGQTDAGSLGMGYRELDRILSMHIEHGLDASDIVARGFDPAHVRRALDACRRAEYKRRQEPMGPVVSFAPFADRAWPVAFGWRDRGEARPATHDELVDGLSSLLGVRLEEQEPDDEPSDTAVAARLQEMVGKLSHQDQIVGAVGDVAFGAMLSGRGPDMDSVMGVPLFSKN